MIYMYTKLIQTSWNTFKPTYTQAHFLHKYYIWIVPLDIIEMLSYTNVHQTSSKKRLNETVPLSSKLNEKQVTKTYSQFYTQNYVNMHICISFKNWKIDWISST